jgi:GAF domain-containing protein
MKMASSEHEVKRLEALHSLKILDTSPEDDYDDLVDLAAMICGCPISLLTFIDHDRQWFKARKGFEDVQTSRDQSICNHAIKQDDVFIVENTINDSRFRHFPIHSGSVNVRFYAGAPVTSPNGEKVGTLCVIDRRPKIMLPQHIDALKKLARQASKLLELRVARQQLRSDQQAACSKVAPFHWHR